MVRSLTSTRQQLQCLNLSNYSRLQSVLTQCRLSTVTWWCKMDNRAMTPFGHCPSMTSLPVWPHCVTDRWNRWREDLNSFPHGEQKTTRTHSDHINEDYPAGPGNHLTSPWMKLSTWLRIAHSGDLCLRLLFKIFLFIHSLISGMHHALIVAHARNKWMNEWIDIS